MADLVRLLRAIQFGDSALPVGSFTFSNGLETAVATGLVHDRATLEGFVKTAVRQSAKMDGVALLAAHRAAASGDIATVFFADRTVVQRKLAEEMRLMSVRMGRKLGELGIRLAPSDLLKAWLEAIRAGNTPGTYPVGLALVFHALDLGERDAFAVHHHGVAAMMLGAALRLMRISFMETQAILLRTDMLVDGFYSELSALTLEDMAGFAPAADILAAAHVKAHVRMFMN
jgi:urease accessory protein